MLPAVGVCRFDEDGYFRARIAQEATTGNAVRPAPVRIQPMAADDVAAAVGKAAVGAPVNGTLEVAGLSGSVSANWSVVS